MTRFSPWVACWCLTLACQSPKPEPATPTHIAKPVPEPNSAVEPRGAASDALHVVADDATLVIRIQGSELRSGPMFGALTGLRDGNLFLNLKPSQTHCLQILTFLLA